MTIPASRVAPGRGSGDGAAGYVPASVPPAAADTYPVCRLCPLLGCGYATCRTADLLAEVGGRDG
jgi:hypothetical protein